MRLRVLTWNLGQGRPRPPAGQELVDAFSGTLASWEWDVAVLQQVAPPWPPALARALGAEYRLVLTSGHGLLPLRRAIAKRWPDLIRSHGGGANAILARSDRVVLHRTQRLRRLPERRWAHAVRLACGIWVANVQASADPEGAAWRDGRRAAATTLGWANGEALVLAGDFTLRRPRFEGLRHVAGREADHIFASPGLWAVGEAQVLEHGRQSDHPRRAQGLTRGSLSDRPRLAQGVERGSLSDHPPLAATLELRVPPGTIPEAAEGGISDIR